MANVAVTNLTNGVLSVGGLTWQKGEVKNIERNGMNKDIHDAIVAGTQLSAPAGTFFADTTDLPESFTNTTGTPVAASNGVVALAAITDVATAANAIATLAKQLEAANIRINALEKEINADNA